MSFVSIFVRRRAFVVKAVCWIFWFFNNFAMSSFGTEGTNDSLVNSNERPTGNKRSAPIDDDVENLRSPKKRKPTNSRRQRGKDEEVSNGEGNEESDSGESFQSLADIRTKRKVRR